MDTCACWDFHPTVRAWRQERYDLALDQGYNRHKAFLETFPIDLEGYIDDSLCPTIDLFVDMFFFELLLYCDSAGIVVSDSKF